MGVTPQTRAGRRPFPTGLVALGLIPAVTLLAFLIAGRPLEFDYAELKGFNFHGGLAIQPELIALTLGLVIYTGAFIAEIVRAGVQGVPKGQKEAAAAIGLSPTQTLRLVNEANTFRPQLRTRSFSTTAATCAPSMPVRLHERSPTLICRC